MRFAIFTHVEHASKGADYSAYAPYIREMNIWLRHVKQLEIVASLSSNKNSTTYEVYRHDQISLTSVPAFNLLGLKNIFRSIFLLPLIAARTFTVMYRADHIHLRCPGNIGLIACFCQIFFPKKAKTAKYAGNWDPKSKQPWSYKLQKWILKNPFLTRNIKVLVYGDWPDQTGNIKPFFTASFSEAEIKEVRGKTFEGAFTFLFVGNLVPGKRPIESIRLVHNLKESGCRVNLEIYGHGPERDNLESYCQENNLQQDVKFHGNRPLEELKAAYQKAHFVILPSSSEGWPKALAEGMFFGCIPIATPVSCVPWMLGDGSRGVLLQSPLLDTFQKNRQFECPDEHRDVSRTGFSEILEETRKGRKVLRGQGAVGIEKILCLLRKPQEMQRMSMEAKRWSQQYTLERFEEGIKEVLNVSGRKKSEKPANFPRPPLGMG